MKRLKLDLNEFRHHISSKKILCYGGGDVGIRVIAIMENWGKQADILGFIDSNPNKWDKRLCYDKFSYPIISIDRALKNLPENVIILVTCSTMSANISEIMEMLNQYEELRNIECFSIAEIAQQQLLQSDYKEIVRESENMLIPKKIHYCWFGGKKPIFIEHMIDSWKEMCPDYEVIEWNEKNYDFTKNKYMRQAYAAKMWGFVSDYVRLDIIYRYGGIYLDTDVKILKSPDDLLYQKCFFIKDASFFVNTGGGFGAQKGALVLKEMMDYYEEIPFISEDCTMNKQSCVLHQYNILKRYGLTIDDQFQTVCEANIYPMLLDGTDMFTMQVRNSEKAYFAHYGTAIWVNNSLECRRKSREYFKCEGLDFYNIDI